MSGDFLILEKTNCQVSESPMSFTTDNIKNVKNNRKREKVRHDTALLKGIMWIPDA